MAGEGSCCGTRPVYVLSVVFVVILVVVIVAEYFIVHNMDENNLGSDSASAEETTTMMTTPMMTTPMMTTTAEPMDLYALPPGWIMASATSAYQVEGAWNYSDKGESIWDTFSHLNMTSNGDDACKSFELYKTDVQMIVKTGFNAYRFSISWTRILPYGFNNYTSADGIAYYHSLLDELLAHNITPLVTLYHWDLPQVFQDMGGWLNSSMADRFVEYADVVFSNFGGKVKWWITFNEPDLICSGYSGTSFAPGANDSGVSDYKANHNILRAHGKAYQLYNSTYKPKHKGSVGMTFNIPAVFPVNASSPEDREAADRTWNWRLGLYAHPVYSREGNYPSIVRERVDSNSFAENRTESRLPHFTYEELEEMRGAHDFIGVNYYFDTYRTAGESGANPCMNRDSATTTGTSSTKTEGLKTVLNYLKDNYNDPLILITETGFNTATEGLNDTTRITRYHNLIKQTLEAKYLDGCKVIGFTAWSLMDNMEWNSGYTPKYGIWQVNFTDVNRTRTMKASGYWFQKMLSTWHLPNTTGWET